MENSLYDILEVSPRASSAVIRAAYRCLAQIWHPDKNPGSAAALERSSALNSAYAVLGDELRRARYDGTLMKQTEERRGAAAPAAKAPAAAAAQATPRRFAFRPLHSGGSNGLSGSGRTSKSSAGF